MIIEKIIGSIQAYQKILKYIDTLDPNRESLDFNLLRQTIPVWVNLLEESALKNPKFIELCQKEDLLLARNMEYPAKLNSDDTSNKER